MGKALTICSKHGCPDIATYRGMCDEHKVRHKRGSTSAWRKTRERVLDRDQHQCTYIHTHGDRCRVTTSLEIHHVIPVKHGGTDDLLNLTALCHEHHLAAGIHLPQ